ncbi:MAG: dephospho-CoA kinase [Clostridia bacterium]|nr:dephospho-CoA kinase [Clostridia bacterium]
MIKIGICGSSGSGKGYTCLKFKKYGVEHIDTDKIYREIAVSGSPCVLALSDYFGNGILDSNGGLDRRELSKRVFEGEDSAKNLKMLNTITHKYIRLETKRILSENEKNGVAATLIDAPVLFESGFDDLCDVTLCVTAPKELKIQRIIKRDGITREKAEARLGSQLTDDELRSRCDYEIINDDITDIDKDVRRIMYALGIEIKNN